MMIWFDKAKFWLMYSFTYGLRRYGGPALLLLIYLVLVLTYSYVIPFSKGPDEYINYQYILYIAKHQRLPATIAERQEAGVKAEWQPFYHIVGGIAAAPILLTKPPELKVTWDPPTRQLIDLVLPRATLIRTEDERFPHQGEYAVWQTGRWVSVALGVGTLFVTYFICLTLWPGHYALAIGVTAFLVFIPRFLFTHAVLSDDTMLGFCLSLYLLILIRMIKVSSQHLVSWWYFFGLGVTAGLAIVTKYTAIPVIVGTLVTGWGVAYRQNWPWRDILRRGVVFFGAFFLAVSWWIIWVWWHFDQVDTLGPVMGLIKPLLPGTSVDDNPTTSRLTALLSGQSLSDFGEAPGAGGSFFDWAWHTFITFWSITVYGAEPIWPYPHTLNLIVLALFCVFAVIGLWRGYLKALAIDKIIGSALVIHLLIFFPIPLLRFALSRRLNDAAQGRHLLFPAGPAIIILLVAGWLAWFRPHWRHRIALLLGSFMLLWSVSHLAYLWQAYPSPLPVRTTPGPQMQVEQPVRINFNDTLLLSGYQTKLVNNGAVLQLDLVWQGLNQAWEDYVTEITLIDYHSQPKLRWISHPANGRFPVRAWQLGDTVRDTLYLPLSGLSPGTYIVQLRLLGWDRTPLASSQGEMVELTGVTLLDSPQLTSSAFWMYEKAYSGSQFFDFLNRKVMPIYRYRSTIPITIPEPVEIFLVGPDKKLRTPITDVGYLRTFLVDHDWPSGEYHLYVNGDDSNLAVRVENFDTYPGGWNFTLPEMQYPVQANFAGQIELLGYDLPTRRVEAGAGIPLVLYWRGLTQMHEDYKISVQLLDSDLQRRGGYDRLPRETYNTYLWVPGEVVDDGFAVPVEANAPDGVYTIRVGLYLQRDEKAVSLPLVQNGKDIDETSVVIGPIKVGNGPTDVIAPDTAPENLLNIDLGGVIRLQGYDLELAEETMILKLYWYSINRTEIDYTTFVHVHDPAGEIVAQLDRPPVNGVYPTSLWDPDEMILDEMTISLTNPMPAEEYTIAVGLYDYNSGQRLPVAGSADDSIQLFSLQ